MTRRSVANAVTITTGVGPGAKPQIDCDLVPEELQAIGLITAQWAHLEHCVCVRAIEIAQGLGQKPPDEIRSLSFTKRMHAFRRLATQLEIEESKKWVRIADRIANAEGRRHKVTHGLWTWDNSKDGELVALSSMRPPHNFEIHIDIKQLKRLGDDIGEILFDLSFPGGLVEALLTAAPIPPRSGPLGSE